ncbi:MAG: SDR family NAD(P)-dependent oxidoreductase [Betaproteobacteria bacterium]|nr:SDR family NAD(P)-dependent oxidoreductase [Betaproteobacteria bacterium]
MTGAGLRIAVFGATSALAQAAVRRWAAQGASLVLVARDAGRLDAVAADALVHGAATVERQVADFSSAARMPDVAANAWNAREGLDVALLAWGSLTDQARAQRDVGYLAAELEANFVAFACLAEALAGRMRAQGGGTIALIGSVAGDRARGTLRLRGREGGARRLRARTLDRVPRARGARRPDQARADRHADDRAPAARPAVEHAGRRRRCDRRRDRRRTRRALRPRVLARDHGRRPPAARLDRRAAEGVSGRRGQPATARHAM